MAYNAGPSQQFMGQKKMGTGQTMGRMQPNRGMQSPMPMKPPMMDNPMGNMGNMPMHPPMPMPPVDNIRSNMPVPPPPNIAGPTNDDLMGIKGAASNNIQMPGVQPWGMRFGGSPMNIGPQQNQQQMPLFQRYNNFNRGMM